MRQIKEVLKRYDLKPFQYQKVGNAYIVKTKDERYVIKKIEQSNQKIFDYLKSRSFDYYPDIINDYNDGFEITKYLNDFDYPKEQKILDMMDLVSLLHNKTTYYKEVDEAEYKKLYEDISNNILHLKGYYMDILLIIESQVYMSPSGYLLARNITKIFSALNYCKEELEVWWEMVKEKSKQRVAVIHNNLEPDHFLRNDNSYLLSWSKAKIDTPVFDLYKLYKRTINDYDFTDIIKRYEYNYGLNEDEKKLLFILISLPDKLIFEGTEYEQCKKISIEIDRLYKTEKFLGMYHKT